MFSDDPAIHTQHLSKCYHVYGQPRDRLLQMLFRGRRRYFQEFWALRDVSFTVAKGECLGIVGRNGAGKSTLLQLVCGTLSPTEGTLAVQGRVAALLELGAGFNPDFSGRENVLMNAAIMGLSREEIDERYEQIVDFSGIGAFIDQPVKTYSSGMYIRLAFSVASSVDPDILVIDEALSVGDGEFARKSFDRIMTLRASGKTILFCSHSLYQIETLCDRAIWIDQGCVRLLGQAAEATVAYQAALNGEIYADAAEPSSDLPGRKGSGRVVAVHGSVAGQSGKALQLCSLKNTLTITVEFMIDPELPSPTVALGFANSSGITVASVSSFDEDVRINVTASGFGRATVVFPEFPLLKGEYRVTAVLACENAVHIYDVVEHCLLLHVTQQRRTQGLVELPHRWGLT
ncbi:MAG: ABC transporter ATP-binding protein [Desulfuromonadales bacterium]|nr:ABC transporter ATP-binding protein [Desulfuromonadales bacterium]